MENDDIFEELGAQATLDYCMYLLHELSTAAGSLWDCNDPSTMEIIVTNVNADSIYGCCQEIRSIKNSGLTKSEMRKINEARQKAHEFLYEEANNPETTIQRKIELVRLTSR